MVQVQHNQLVYCNGKPLDHCIAYDIEKGIARCNEYKDSKIVMDGEHRAKVVQVKGKIEVKDAKQISTSKGSQKVEVLKEGKE